MRLKILLLTALCANLSAAWATSYVYPGNATAPLTLQGDDTLEIVSGTFDGGVGSTFTLSNSATSNGQSVTIDSGATLTSTGGFGIYLPSNGPFTINNQGTLAGVTVAVFGTGFNTTLNQNSATSDISGTVILGQNSTVNFNSTKVLTGPLAVGANSTINFNNTLTYTQRISAPNSTININTGTATLGNFEQLTGSLNVLSGATLAMAANTISGSGNINVAGTLTASGRLLDDHTGIFTTSGTTTITSGITLLGDFRVTGGTTTFNTSSFVTVANKFTVSGGTLNLIGGGYFYIDTGYGVTYTQTGGTCTIATGNSFQINNGSKFIISGGTFTKNSGGSVTFNNGTFQQDGGIVNFASGATINDTDVIITGGTFNHTAGSVWLLNSGSTYTQTGGSFISSASGGITLNGGASASISGGTFNITGGAFIMQSTNNQFYLSGTPTIVLNSGITVSSSNANVIFFEFSNNSLPKIQVPNNAVNIGNATINITNANEIFIVPGDYAFITSNGSLTLGNVSLPTNTNFTNYSLVNSGGVGYVRVARVGTLDEFALTPYSQEVGRYLETVIESLNFASLGSQIYNAIGNLQNSITRTTLNNGLFQVSPQSVTTLAHIANIDSQFQQIGARLVALRAPKHYIAGDNYSCDNMWIAPYGDYARQSSTGNLLGYVSKTAGVLIGTDTTLSTGDVIGAAVGYGKARVKPTDNMNSYTSIQSYQVALYGSYVYKDNSHLDWLLAYSTNANYGNRSIDVVGLHALSSFRSFQYAAKGIYSKEYCIGENTTVAPEASAEYVYWWQQAYSESGAGALDYNVGGQNTYLLRGGVGSWFTFKQPMFHKTLIPQLYAGMIYDFKAASQNVSANLVNTTPLFVNSGTPTRLGVLFGGRATMQFNCHLSAILNVNFQVKSRYYEEYANLRIRYLF